jgi:hypothetical protein
MCGGYQAGAPAPKHDDVSEEAAVCLPKPEQQRP